MPDPGWTHPGLFPDPGQTCPEPIQTQDSPVPTPGRPSPPRPSPEWDRRWCRLLPGTARCGAVQTGCGQGAGTCQRRSPAILLALLLRVELVPIALAASVAERDALALSRVEGPARHRLLAGALDDGQPAGSCGDRGCSERGGSGPPIPPTWMLDKWGSRPLSDPL